MTLNSFEGRNILKTSSPTDEHYQRYINHRFIMEKFKTSITTHKAQTLYHESFPSNSTDDLNIHYTSQVAQGSTYQYITQIFTKTHHVKIRNTTQTNQKGKISSLSINLL